jgi:SPOR domain
VIQQGQVLKLKARCADGEPLWAYRYRVAGRGSARLQVGGFSSRAEAQRALQNKLARLVPGDRSATMTLGEWVAEHLEAHQGERDRGEAPLAVREGDHRAGWSASC